MSVPRICLFVFLFFCSLATAFSQKRKSAILQYDTAARAGAIVLMDGTRIRGRLVFNDNDGIVTLYDETSDGLRAFTSRSVVKFQMAGAEGGRDKVYYSLEFEDPDTGINNPEFFEVLKELDSFIVLVKIERLKTEARRGLLQPKQSPMMVDRASRKFTQAQIVYFLDMERNFEPYVKILEEEVGGDLLDWNDTHNQYINRDLFEKYTGMHFPTLVAYAKENKLSFKRKEHIILILDQYKQLDGR